MKEMNKSARAAAVLIGIGMLLFVFRYSIPVAMIPMASWPVLLLGIGLLVGVLSKFRHPMSFALILIGLIFTFNTNLPIFTGWYILPLVFITSGILTMLVTKSLSGHSNKEEVSKNNN